MLSRTSRPWRTPRRGRRPRWRRPAPAMQLVAAGHLGSSGVALVGRAADQPGGRSEGKSGRRWWKYPQSTPYPAGDESWVRRASAAAPRRTLPGVTLSSQAIRSATLSASRRRAERPPSRPSWRARRPPRQCGWPAPPRARRPAPGPRWPGGPPAVPGPRRRSHGTRRPQRALELADLAVTGREPFGHRGRERGVLVARSENKRAERLGLGGPVGAASRRLCTSSV